MIRALVIKELRESAALAAVATLGIAYALAYLTGCTPFGSPSAYTLPFVDGDFLGALVFVCSALALLLGLKQTAWEEFRGTYHYLLHRPVDRGRVFLIKAAVGIGLVQLLGALMILIYGAWAATPGTHASPFFWSMTVPTWRAWMALPIVYLGALLCGLRPASWYGSRLMPLVACGALALIIGALPWAWMTVVGVALVGGLLTACILFVVRTRDF